MDQFSVTPQPASQAAVAVSAERVTAFLRKVYGWMCVGLAVTAVVALAVAGSPTLVQAIFANKILFFGLIIARARPRLLSLGAGPEARVEHGGRALPSGYSALNGVDALVRSSCVYTGTSIATTFVVTAGMFGALALYGIDHEAQPRRRRPVRLHGPDRRRARVDRRDASGTPTACSSSSRSSASSSSPA